MAISETANQIFTKLEPIAKVNEQNLVEGIDKAYDVWRETLPEGQTVESVKALADHRKAFGSAFYKVFGTKIVEHAKEHKDVSYMNALVKTEDVSFGFDYARPDQDSPSKDVLKAGMGLRCDVDLSTDCEEILDDLAGIWD